MCACEQILKKDVLPDGTVLKTTPLKSQGSCQKGYLHECIACLVSKGLVVHLGSKNVHSSCGVPTPLKENGEYIRAGVCKRC